MEFKSQICTTVEQSKRLIELGLKKETADITWKFSHTTNGEPVYDCILGSTWTDEVRERYIKIGEKTKLFERWKHPDGTQMSGAEIYDKITENDLPAWSLHRLLVLVEMNTTFEDYDVVNAYDKIIGDIAFDIRHDQFNYEYLEDKKCLEIGY